MHTRFRTTTTLALILLAAPLAGCGKSNNQNQNGSNTSTMAPAEQTTGGGAPAQQAAPPPPPPAQSQPASASPPPSKAPPPSETPPPAQAAPPPAAAPQDVRHQLRAAASHFKRIAEAARNAGFHRLDRMIGRAKSEARDVRTLLPRAAWRRLMDEMDRMDRARRHHERGAIADAANAGYRILNGRDVRTAPPPGHHADHADHAGLPHRAAQLRSDANQYRQALEGRHTHWRALRRHADDVRQGWDALRHRVDNRPLRHDMTKAVNDMQHAADHRNERQARHAVRQALDTLDRVDRYLRRH